MKQISYIISFIALAILMTSCGKDNFDEPTSNLTGQIMYKGTPLQLRGSAGAIQLQIYQSGFEKTGGTNVYVDQNGTFNAKVFDGEYKIITADKNGPWVNKRDTIKVTVKGNTVKNLEVIPYYMVSNETIAFKDTSSLECSCTITKTDTTSTTSIDAITLYIGGTTFVDNSNNLGSSPSTTKVPGDLTFSFDMSKDKKKWASIKKSKVLYGRIGVKAKGATQSIYSKMIKLR